MKQINEKAAGEELNLNEHDHDRTFPVKASHLVSRKDQHKTTSCPTKVLSPHRGIASPFI